MQLRKFRGIQLDLGLPGRQFECLAEAHPFEAGFNGRRRGAGVVADDRNGDRDIRHIRSG